MQQAAASAGRILRSSLDARALSSGSRNQAISFNLNSRANNDDNLNLSSRLSQRLHLTDTPELTGSLPASASKATSKVKKRNPMVLGSGKAVAKRTEDNAAIPAVRHSEESTRWSTVDAALHSLEDSITRTNSLLHSLASGEGWARQSRSRSRVSWAVKEASGSRLVGPRSTAASLAALLQELSRKQAVAANMLSKLSRLASSALPMYPPPSSAFEGMLARNTPTLDQCSELSMSNRKMFESGWGPDALKPPEKKCEFTPMSPGSVDRIPVDSTLDESAFEISNGTLQGTIQPEATTLETIVRDPQHVVPVPVLQHGLDRVLFNPGVHWLQDPHSRVYNFSPELQAMPAFTSFAYDRELAELARRQGKKFTGSTSSVSMILAHIYFLLSGWRDVDISVLSSSFVDMSKEYSAGQKMPYTFLMRQNDGVIAFDSGSSSSDPLDQNVLSYIGVMLEKLLTLPKNDFELLLHSNPDALAGKSVIPEREAYRYSMSKSMVLRSQLDCVDNRLPGTGVFDLKTRAAISVRQDIWNFEIGSGYQLRTAVGPFESFEREYYDLCRSAMLKYSFQARIGAMDGVFVAYHNTSRMFGFQYIPVTEMDERLFGSHEGGERVFRACLQFLEVVAECVSSTFPEQDVKATVCTSESKDPELFMWVEPAVWSESTPIPVHELRLKVRHTINGEPMPSGARVTFEKPDWKITYNITRIGPCEAVNARYNKALTKQEAIRTSCLPEGTTIEELSDRMKDGVLEGYSSRTSIDTEGTIEAKQEDVSPSAPEAWNRRFRTRATPFVQGLRQLSRKGLEDLDKWSKDDSPKIMYKPRI